MLAEPVPAPGEVLALDATLPHNPGQAPPRGVHSDSTPSSAQVPGYAVLEELGRGGMGVVYKACHLKLNRVVALKMIRGDLADSGERLRFLAEAEAVARVQHPHIVQIFETGTHDGMPFMALEFVEGGSLAARLAGSPLPAKQSAHLGEQLARAVQCAHERGVIHRDLKPANVLLTSEGTPKVTDFGLAKHIESDRGMTQTGAILGTPSYIAPEQASGQGKTIGPAADVYALGAILYECLTGRPPFKAATTLETLLQVVADDPVPPSRLQPRTPHDLETICLKCLNKDPARRYASAAGLADDLGRYLRDEPIRARSPGWPERAWRWCRRNPGMAWLAAVSSLAALALALVVATSGAIVILTNRELERTNKELEQANHSLAGAAELEREVGRLEVTSPLLHKVIRCSILVRQANAAARDGRKSEAREFLSKAIALDESARLGPIEDDRERGPLLAQLASGTEQLIDLEAQEGNVESAVVAATCRNRGLLLGQLLMTGVGSPRPKKEELGKKLSALRARARRGPPDLSALTQEFEQAQREYADISREVLDTDPICRRLGGQAITHERLAGLRERIIGPRKLLLVYHVGRERSYLLLLGDLSEPAQAYPLTIPAEGGERSAVPLGEQTLLDLVTEYQKRVRDAHGGPGLAEQFRETRGVNSRTHS